MNILELLIFNKELWGGGSNKKSRNSCLGFFLVAGVGFIASRCLAMGQK